jgi:hypothetical protein
MVKFFKSWSNFFEQRRFLMKTTFLEENSITMASNLKVAADSVEMNIISGTKQVPTSYAVRNHVIGDLYARYRVERSFHGYHPSVLKSGIQKYARRSVLVKGLWCLVDMDSFSLLEWDGPELDVYLSKYPEETRVNTIASAKRIRTNMVNRLVVMMSEEINISAWWMPSKILDLYGKWTANRGRASSRKYLVEMYLYLTSQKMIRLISDLHAVYLLPPDCVKPAQIKALGSIHEKIRAKYPSTFLGQSEVGPVDWGIDLGGHHRGVLQCVDGIIYNLDKGCDHAFYWTKRLCDLAVSHGYKQNRYFGIVWNILHKFIDEHREWEFVREQVCALETFYKKLGHRERPIYLYHALLLLIRRREIDWNATIPEIGIPMQDVSQLYGDHLRNGKIKIDSYVLDIHTRGGRRGPGALTRFALEGALVKNEEKKFLREDYREIDILLKKELDQLNSLWGKLK